MLLSEWGGSAPSSGCMTQAVLDTLGSVLADMGAGEDPECWIAWGDDPEYKYSVLAPTVAGLVTVAMRLNPGGDGGPRATAKLVRWSKIQIGEFSIEAADGHRVVAVQVEGLVLKGTDQAASDICEFVRGLLAGADGRVGVSAPLVLQALPVSPASAGKTARSAGEAAPQAAGSAPVGKGRKFPKGSKAVPPEAQAEPEPEPEAELPFIAPHPISAEDEPAASPPPALPALQSPQPLAPAPGSESGAAPVAPDQPPQPRPLTREPGSVWEVPAVDPATREQKKPRTWRP